MSTWKTEAKQFLGMQMGLNHGAFRLSSKYNWRGYQEETWIEYGKRAVPDKVRICDVRDEEDDLMYVLDCSTAATSRQAAT